MGVISDILSSVTSSCLPILFNGNISSVVFTSILSPLLNRALETIGEDLMKKNLTKKEMQRMGISYAYSIATIKYNKENNKDFRQDKLFVEDCSENSEVEDIIEAVMKNVIVDSEANKARFYGCFIGNLPFAPQIDYSYSFTIQRIIKNLSYKELCIVRYFKDKGVLKLQSFDSFNNDGQNIKKNELAFYFKDLLSLGVIHKAKPMNMQYELDNMKLSPLGNDIYTLLSLEQIEDVDINSVGTIIERYQ